jgi:hypothetical protein
VSSAGIKRASKAEGMKQGRERLTNFPFYNALRKRQILFAVQATPVSGN